MLVKCRANLLSKRLKVHVGKMTVMIRGTGGGIAAESSGWP